VFSTFTHLDFISIMEKFFDEFFDTYQRLCVLWEEQEEKMTQDLLSKLLSQRMGKPIGQGTICKLLARSIKITKRYRRALAEMKLMVQEQEQGDAEIPAASLVDEQQNAWEKRVEAILKDVMLSSAPPSPASCIRIVLPNLRALPKLTKYCSALSASGMRVEIVFLTL
ncbi:MAG: hypothetical protein AAF399_18335, partial [Bacteroidota bacterium]